MKTEKTKTYLVKRVDQAMDLLLEKCACELSDFTYPWENVISPPMTFKAVHDDQWLYGFFQVTDTDVKVFVDKNEKEEVIYGDRVEIFFRQDAELTSYYCLEIDPMSRVYDYRAAFYRKFDAKWQWPAGELVVQASPDEQGYSVQFAISIRSLKQLGLLKENQLQVGLFRGKCLRPDSGDPHMKWISWIKPHSATPDFHIPSSFGIFQLE